MGGVTVLLAGDFRQTLPVVPKGTRADEVKSCIKKSNLWPQVNILELSKNMRAHLGGDESAGRFSDLLVKIGSGEEKVYTSIDTVVNTDDTTNYLVEFLNSLKPPDLCHELVLRVGTQIMLLRNLKPPKLCNGTRLQVKTLHHNIVEAIILTGCAKWKTIFIPRIPSIPKDNPFDFKRLQFPLKMCFAMTINKSQGQTLKFTAIDMREHCFSHEQFYVACSRVSSPNSLIVLAPNDRLVKNIVYKEVL
ncbi:ATP-dependent DNA helicase pif1-like [Leptinotarsa decemlineata]|uniref:ATP-dependent DNA helicase pif1-like n=1 Tax=Leptinotarsa decemlineata TaxID=7539 RepID=UPI003D3075AC